MTILIRLALAGMISVLAPVFIMGAAAAADLAILGAKIYPTPDSAPIDDGVVVLSDGRIEAVGPRSKVAIPRNARRIDAKGAVLMAGFWNSHIHLMPENLLNAATAKAETLQGGLEAMLTRWVLRLSSILPPRPTMRWRCAHASIRARSPVPCC